VYLILGDPVHTTSADDSAVAEITALLDAATGRILGGDGSGWKDLVSAEDDVTLLGAYGGHTTGHDEVATRFDYVAGTYAGAAGTTWRENVACWVGDEWACFVDIEHHRANLDGSPAPVDFAYRATHLLRRERGVWKVVLRHADPIASFRGPQFAHAQ
jgi:ketosteroid isomerase-like protein